MNRVYFVLSVASEPRFNAAIARKDQLTGSGATVVNVRQVHVLTSPSGVKEVPAGTPGAQPAGVIDLE